MNREELKYTEIYRNQPGEIEIYVNEQRRAEIDQNASRNFEIDRNERNILKYTMSVIQV